MDKETIGARIREQRKKRNLTLDKFAETVGIVPVYLSEIERGIKMPSINTFINIVNAFNVSADSLLCYEITGAKPQVLNEITEKMKDLKPDQLKMINDVVGAMIKNFQEREI